MSDEHPDHGPGKTYHYGFTDEELDKLHHDVVYGNVDAHHLFHTVRNLERERRRLMKLLGVEQEPGQQPNWRRGAMFEDHVLWPEEK